MNTKRHNLLYDSEKIFYCQHTGSYRNLQEVFNSLCMRVIEEMFKLKEKTC